MQALDEKALAQALREGRIRGAGLDVFEREFPYPDPGPSPELLDLANVVVLPHIGSASIASREKMAIMAAENLLAGIRGERLPNCVNPSVYGEDSFS